MAAYRELQRFSENAEMRELERRRRRFREDWQIGIDGAKTAGRDERNIEIARGMKKDGIDPNIITKYTGLSHAEIKRLD